MPLDAIALHALRRELAPVLEGAKIDKVQQPERDLLLFSLRTNCGNKKLLIACGTGSARVHLTDLSRENPAEPPMFCMLLRKHLVGARITALRQPEMERMLVLELEGRDELGDPVSKNLAVELIGRSSNVVLVGTDGRIVDCLRRSDHAGGEQRALLPGLIYRLPPTQQKRSFWDSDEASRRAVLEKADPAQPPERFLLDSFAGLSPLVCRELAFRSGGGYQTLPEQLDALHECVENGEFQPVMLLDTDSGKPLDFSFMPIRQYGPAATARVFASFSELLDAFYERREREEHRRRHSHELQRRVKTVRDRLERKLAAQRIELARTLERDTIRKQAELLTANLYRVKKGQTALSCEDYYEPGCPTVTITLDPLKTPQQNAAAMFREYNKLKNAQSHLTGLIEQGEAQLYYLNSVLDEIERAEGEKELAELRCELAETGYLKTQKKGKSAKAKALPPLRYRSDDGFEILVGRNNLQNDELTTKLGRRTDYWLHTQKVHGSHVIVRCEGMEPSELSLAQAASLAAYHSQGRGGGKLAVDYTMLRNVKKPVGALPGKVVYTDYRTIVAEPDEALAERLKR